MWKKILLGLLLKTVDAFAGYAATTPDPLDDVIAAAIKGLIEQLGGVSNKAEVLAAFDAAKLKLEQS